MTDVVYMWMIMLGLGMVYIDYDYEYSHSMTHTYINPIRMCDQCRLRVFYSNVEYALLSYDIM